MERLTMGTLAALHQFGGLVENAKRFLEKERIHPLYKAYFDLVKEQGRVQEESVFGGMYGEARWRLGYSFVVPKVVLAGGIEVMIRTKAIENYCETSLDVLQKIGPRINKENLSLSNIIMVGVSTPESRQKEGPFSIKWVTISAIEGIRTCGYAPYGLSADRALEYLLYSALIKKKLRKQGNRLAGKSL